MFLGRRAFVRTIVETGFRLAGRGKCEGMIRRFLVEKTKEGYGCSIQTAIGMSPRKEVSKRVTLLVRK